MIVLSGVLVLVALALLVVGAVDKNLALVVASIGVSALSLLLLLVSILQRRGELTGDDAATPVTDTSAEREPAFIAARQAPTSQADSASLTTELLVPAPAAVPDEEPARPASRRVTPAVQAEAPVEEPTAVHEPVVEDASHDDAAPGGQVPEDEAPEDEAYEDQAYEDEAYEDEDGTPDAAGSGVTVLVVSGRPRYHLEGCRVLRGKEPQPLDRDDARMHGFSPCGVCKPDADETAATAQPDAPADQATDDDQSFAASLFGSSPFADPPADEPHDAATSALPDRPVEPDDQPAAAELAVPDRDVEPTVELHGDDPADDPASVTGERPAPVSLDEAAVEDPSAVEEAEQPAEADEPEQPAEMAPVVEAAQSVEPAPAAEERLPEELAVAQSEPLVAAPAEPVEQVPVVAKRGSRRAPAKRPSKAAGADTAAVQPPAARKAPAKKAPAKRSAAEAAPAAPASQVKRPVVRAVRADALRLGAPSTGVTTTRVAARAAAPAAAASVVVVPDRDRFHRPECRFVRDVAGATTLPKPSAARQGYVACGVCKP